MAVKVRQKRQKKKRDDILAEFVYNRGSVSKMNRRSVKERISDPDHRGWSVKTEQSDSEGTGDTGQMDRNYL